MKILLKKQNLTLHLVKGHQVFVTKEINALELDTNKKKTFVLRKPVLENLDSEPPEMRQR